MGYDLGWNDPGILVSTGIADEVPVYTFLYDKSTSIKTIARKNGQEVYLNNS